MKPEPQSTIRESSPRDASAAIAVMARRLLDDVRRKSGIRHDRPLERKLERILASMPFHTLEQWVRVIEAAPPDSPDWLSFIENLTIHGRVAKNALDAHMVVELARGVKFVH